MPTTRRFSGVTIRKLEERAEGPGRCFFEVTICDFKSGTRLMPKSTALAPLAVDSRILSLRGVQVLLDTDLAEIYGVPTKASNPAVKRNAERFPEDFRFRLKAVERDWGVTNCDPLSRLKFSPSLPWAFTEHGAIMAATVLNSPRAVEMSVFVVRAFVRLRTTPGPPRWGQAPIPTRTIREARPPQESVPVPVVPAPLLV